MEKINAFPEAQEDCKNNQGQDQCQVNSKSKSEKLLVPFITAFGFIIHCGIIYGARWYYINYYASNGIGGDIFPKINIVQNDSIVINYIKDHHIVFPNNLLNEEKKIGQKKKPPPPVIEDILKYAKISRNDPNVGNFVILGEESPEITIFSTFVIAIYNWEGLLIGDFHGQNFKNNLIYNTTCLSQNSRAIKVGFNDKEAEAEDEFFKFEDTSNTKNEDECFPLSLIIKAAFGFEETGKINLLWINLKNVQTRRDLQFLNNFPFNSIYIKAIKFENLDLGLEKNIELGIMLENLLTLQFSFVKISNSIFVHK